MSDPSGSSSPPPVPRPPAQRHGCLTALMIAGGCILLLPGLCAILVGGGSIIDRSFDSSILPLVAVGLLAGVGGILLIRAAIRRG